MIACPGLQGAKQPRLPVLAGRSFAIGCQVGQDMPEVEVGAADLLVVAIGLRAGGCLPG